MQTYWLVGPKQAYIQQANHFQSTDDIGMLSDFHPRMYQNDQRRNSCINVINRLPSFSAQCPFNPNSSQSFI
jgi:hypothetical protein